MPLSVASGRPSAMARLQHFGDQALDFATFLFFMKKPSRATKQLSRAVREDIKPANINWGIANKCASLLCCPRVGRISGAGKQGSGVFPIDTMLNETTPSHSPHSLPLEASDKTSPSNENQSLPSDNPIEEPAKLLARHTIVARNDNSRGMIRGVSVEVTLPPGRGLDDFDRDDVAKQLRDQIKAAGGVLYGFENHFERTIDNVWQKSKKSLEKLREKESLD